MWYELSTEANFCSNPTKLDTPLVMIYRSPNVIKEMYIKTTILHRLPYSMSKTLKNNNFFLCYLYCLVRYIKLSLHSIIKIYKHNRASFSDVTERRLLCCTSNVFFNVFSFTDGATLIFLVFKSLTSMTLDLWRLWLR